MTPQYAMVDREDDLKLGIRSTAILFAESDRVIIGGLQVLMLSNLVVIGQRAALAWPYYAGLAVVRGAVRLPAIPDPRSQPRRLLRRIHEQQLGGRRDLCRPRRLSTAPHGLDALIPRSTARGARF
jgi:4-hydroxybenzoate polyprenyltransferase